MRPVMNECATRMLRAALLMFHTKTQPRTQDAQAPSQLLFKRIFQYKSCTSVCCVVAVAIAATKVQAYSAQAPVVFRLLSHFAHPRAPRGHEPSAIRSRSQKLLARTAADSATAAAAAELSRRLVPHMLPPCGCCRRAWRSAVLQGCADSILPRILLPPRPHERM